MSTWDAAAFEPGVWVRELIVLGETGSTQDSAREIGRTGVAVVAERQTAGRGRLGRVWSDERGLGLAITFALDGSRLSAAGVDNGVLALAGGLAALDACRAGLARASGPGIGLGLRWPNDVVERGGAGRKIAGVLTERTRDVVLLGVGINVHQREEDFPPGVRGRAVSLAMLGSGATRAEVAGVLAGAMNRRLSQSGRECRADWSREDTLLGSVRTFEYAGRRVRGVVEAIEPIGAIVVRDEAGAEHVLPAFLTSMIHDA